VNKFDGRYSFIAAEQDRDRPTVPAQAPEPTDQELQERLENTERQLELLSARRHRILRKLGRAP
jgi:hypothetical protein